MMMIFWGTVPFELFYLFILSSFFFSHSGGLGNRMGWKAGNQAG
jgi:hypothetical protein